MTRVEKEQMIEGLVGSLPLGIMIEQTRELLLGKRKIIEFVLENNT